MRALGAITAIAALLVGFVYAPLFHMHSAGDSGTGHALIHAHFPESERIPPDLAVGAHHSHVNARSVDIVSATPAHAIHSDAVVPSAFADFEIVRVSLGFVVPTPARAHAPPAATAAAPRSPPRVSISSSFDA